jgi:beta-lactamase class A
VLNFFKKEIPLYFILIAVIASAAVAIIVSRYYLSMINNTTSSATQGANTSSYSNCNFSTPRLGGYDFIKPLLFVEPGCESEKLNGIKTAISSYLDQLKTNGTLSAASVYVKDLSSHEWTGYNADEKHNPGSLLKIPEMIALLRMEEMHPGFLQKKILFTSPLPSEGKSQTEFLSKTIEKGKTYSILQLMQYMVSYSDNDATLLLNSQLDATVFTKTFTDLGLAAPDWNAKDYPVSARDYSLFLRALYNASYLNITHSEMATELMSTCDFKDGFYKGLPEKTKLAHKYGMAMYNNEHELSESGIIYINDKAYVLTVMTRGKDFNPLPGILQQTCQLVYSRIAAIS